MFPKKSLKVLLSIFTITLLVGLGFRVALALNYIDFSGADTQDIRWPAGQTLSFVQGGSERLRIDATTGNVVIPQGLTVSGTFSMTGTYTGSVSAGNISSGDFGSNYSGGNFSFPANVGIGTTAPIFPLQVVGVGAPAVTATNMLANTSFAISTGNTQWADEMLFGRSGGANNTFWHQVGKYDAAAGQMVGYTYLINPIGGDIRMSNNALNIVSGNVGIGTTSPGWLLDVNGNAMVRGALYLSIGQAVTASTQTGADLSIYASGATGAIQLGTNGDRNRLVVASTGNVGIGTTSPGLFGDTKSLTLSSGTSGDVIASFEVQGARTTDAAFGAIRFYHKSNLGATIQGVRNGADNSVALYFGTANAGTVTNNMVIDKSGNVGIGTTAPGAKLDIEGNLYMYTGGSWFYMLSQNSRNIYLATAGGGIVIDQAGNVGIGTTSPGAKLDVNGDTIFRGTTHTLMRAATNNYNILLFGTAAGSVTDWGIYTGNVENTSLAFYNYKNPGTVMYFGYDNNVNIVNNLNISGLIKVGSTRNTYVHSTEDSDNAHIYRTGAGVGDFSQLAGHLVLQARVQGTVYRDIIFAGGLSTAGPLMTIKGDGNVGIGTTGPGYKLDVVGDINITGSYRVNGSAIGAALWAASGNNIYNTNSGNVGIGTTGPSDKLYIIGNDNQITVDTVSEGAAGIFLRQAGVRQWELYDYQDKFHLYNYGTASDSITVLQSNEFRSSTISYK
ncbi:MAG: hypothetical protein UX33_C0042G0002 [Candidatus Azambacteria bacterium GW2011_GWC1_46_13]|uniref:Uncharacterized protein n=1 Tax=Candidatus Azambacteria bacterium GW2011_GWC1_46_13 TaxID=1618619 RepID=A0A0G1RID0_9BACT|nr:MAG: hypothetical protein UX33_C0042G0002 [Candidatus Azambacteria bacterium GW2011_GWC1_46_13]